MKLSLVVASGVHTGKAIPITGAEFLIGRDEDCHLRPASPAISKKHCAVLVRDGKIYVLDLGSTNGTLVNDEPLTGEVEVKNGDRLKVGPLDFAVTVVGSTATTPVPDAVKKPVAGAAPKLAPSSTTVKPVPAPKPVPKSVPKPASKAEILLDDADSAAAMLLGMGDEDPPGSEPHVPEGSTVMELPAVDAAKLKELEGKKKDAPMSQAESSSAASEILRKYMRRPK